MNKLSEYEPIDIGGDFTRIIKNIKNAIMKKSKTPIPAENMKIAFKNGTLEWVGKEIRWIDWKERSPKDFSFHFIPWEVRIEKIKKFLGKKITLEDLEELAKEECPKALEAFKQWVGNKWPTLLEIIGYALYPKNEYKKAFMLVGGANAGKTSFINLLQDILGADNFSAVTIDELFNSQNRFAVSNLYHKLANMTSETAYRIVDDVNKLKRLLGEDPITADVKYEKPITFVSYAKLIMTTNKLPIVKDKVDKAFWDRWMIIEFPNEFPKNRDWYKETFTKEEIEGIITVAIVALMRVKQNGRFDFEQTPEEVRDIWLSDIDTVYGFIRTEVKEGKLKLDPQLWIGRKELYKMYKEYCYEIGENPIGITKFTRKLEEYFRITLSFKGTEKVFVGIGKGGDEMIKRFLDYITKNREAEKGFLEIVNDFNGNLEEANKFVKFCTERGLCTQLDKERYKIMG